MKLLTKTNLYFLFLGVPFLLIAGLASYFVMTTEVEHSNYDLLRRRKSEIEKIILAGDTVSMKLIEQSGEASLKRVSSDYFIDEYLGDTLIYDANEEEMAPNAIIVETFHTKNGNFLIKVWRSTLEFEELAGGIVTALVIILFFFFAIFIYINWWVSKNVWTPFYQALEILKVFRPNTGQPIMLPGSTIKEFSDFNNVANEMMHKMIADFKSQKQFTENAAHELQTPLAIIKTKIDLLIQSKKIGKEETDIITSLDHAVTRLSKLNKALLLLTKIENRQFVPDTNVSLNKIIDDSLDFFAEHISEKQIVLSKEFNSDVVLHINPDLCAIMVSNLLQNAIRHCPSNGVINIILDSKHLDISNSGESELDASTIFARFQKKSSAPESLGLGLAIANEIADASGLELVYFYANGRHHFAVRLA